MKSSRRTFLSLTAGLSLNVANPAFAASAFVQANTPEDKPSEDESTTQTKVLGPIIGHSDERLTVIWLRPTAPGDYLLEVVSLASSAKSEPIRLVSRADEGNDLCVQWRVEHLTPGESYRYRVLAGQTVIAESEEQVIVVPAPADQPGKLRLAISSCAREDRGSRQVWQQMNDEKVDGVILLGDTPYIDSTDLAEQTKRHREFAGVAEYQQLLQSHPCWWTWDDHDFAGNDSAGLATGKENSRLVFTRYRPQAAYGDGHGGIYTSFRRGPAEVFLLDTRWFAMTEASFADSAKPTLLGKQQWEWLKQGLTSSTAPFKLLACGIIWDDKENTESDDWGTYRHELNAIQKFIGEHRISGVIFVGGDIHASRVLKYRTEKTVGYDLVQFIASPIHGSTIPSLNVYNPDLVRSAVEPHVFLRLDMDSTVDPPALKAVLINRRGEHVFSYHLDAAQLHPGKNE